MSQLLLLQGNPKKRGRRKPRSAAQKAATRRMLAARGLHHNPTKKRRKARRSAVAASPARHHVRRARRTTHRHSAGGAMRSVRAGAVPMLKSGVIGGAGAVGVDVLMGYASNILPATMTSKLNADGSTNFMYYAAKAALALGVGIFGRRIMPAGIAVKIGEGSLTVMSYELLRGMMPAGIAMGYMNPAHTMGRVMSTQRPQLARVMSFNTNMNTNLNRGANAAARMNSNANR
jgi:hypothetical protein